MLEDGIMAEKKGIRGYAEVYSSEVTAEPRKFMRKGDSGEYDAVVETMINGQEIQVSSFNYSRQVRVQEEVDGAIYGLLPEGWVSAVAGRVSGFATDGRNSPSRCRLVELMEKISSDKVVAFHVAIGVTTKKHKQLAYSAIGYVQFATHAGRRRALDREIMIGGKAIVVDRCRKEFVLERLRGFPKSFRGPRCVLNGDENERRSEWKSLMNYWRSDPFEWSHMMERMLSDNCVTERNVEVVV